MNATDCTSDANFEAKSPICYEIYNHSNRINKVLPCGQGHVICLQCLKELFKTPAPSENCYLHGKNCTASRPHATCPLCKDVFHLPQDNINLVISIPSTEKERKIFGQDRLKVRREIFQKSILLQKHGQEIITKLKNLQNDVNTYHYNCSVARLSGSVPAVVGCVLFATGAAFSFITFGASTALMVAGGALSSVGGLTASGATVAEIVKNSETKTEFNQLVSQCQVECKEFVELLHELSIMDSVIDVGPKFWLRNGVGLAHVGQGIGTVVGIIRFALENAKLVQHVAGNAVRLMANAGRIMFIFGALTAGIMLPFDIIAVVLNAQDIHKRNPSELDSLIQEAINGIDESCVKAANEVEQKLKEIDQDLPNNDQYSIN